MRKMIVGGAIALMTLGLAACEQSMTTTAPAPAPAPTSMAPSAADQQMSCAEIARQIGTTEAQARGEALASGYTRDQARDANKIAQRHNQLLALSKQKQC